MTHNAPRNSIALLLLALAPALHADPALTVAARFAPPDGYRRVATSSGSFGSWLRTLRLLPGRPPVRLFDGRLKGNQRAHVAVLDLDVGERDLQQCADAVIRLRAEYLSDRDCDDEIAFDFTSGDRARWSDWRRGLRPVVQGRHVSWSRSAVADDGPEAFRAYLETVFTYAGTASLQRELVPVDDPTRVEPGDVFIEGGFPGHAVLVLDVVENAAGERRFLLAQSYMPAQQIHVLRGPDGPDPWYPALRSGPLETPEWSFDHGDLRRFPGVTCPAAPEEGLP